MSRDAAISCGLALVVGDAWMSEAREWPEFCFKCGTKKEDPWTNPSPHAAWRRTLVDHDEFEGVSQRQSKGHS